MGEAKVSMPKRTRPADPQGVFCEVCLKRIAKSEALTMEGRDFVAHFCSNTCYDRWRGARAPQAPVAELQEDAGRSKSRDERVKRLVKRHPQRDEPRADSIESDELPPP